MVFKNIAILTAALFGATHAAPSTHDLGFSMVSDDDTSNITSVICKPSEYGWCPTDKIEEGISYLNGKDGYTEFGWQAGGGYCTRVSCEEDSGIYVCNDNEYNIWVHYDTMAAYAKYIINYNNSSQTACSWTEDNVEGSGLDKQVTWGQAFDKNGFNVIVGMREYTSC